MTTEDKLKKILDKEELNSLPVWVAWVKNYSLTRFANEVKEVNQTAAKLQEKISEITNGGKQ